jgi:hypothetical protein
MSQLMMDRRARIAARKERLEAEKADDQFRAVMPPDDGLKRESKQESHGDDAANRLLKKLSPKQPANGRQHPKRAALDKATLVGGSKRQGRKKRKGKKCVGLDGPASRGLRFPDKKETTEQHRNLKKIMVGYIRRLTVKQFSAFTDETLAGVLGISDRQVRNVRSEIKKPGRRHEDLEMTMEVLHGMQSGLIAGVLGTPHNEESRAIFSVVHNTGRWLADGKPAGVHGSDAGLFDMFKASFEIDYELWKRESQPWPYKKDGSDRKTSSKNGTRQIA